MNICILLHLVGFLQPNIRRINPVVLVWHLPCFMIERKEEAALQQIEAVSEGFNDVIRTYPGSAFITGAL